MENSNREYFGFNPPGLIPQLFAPNLLGTQYHEHSAPSFSLDGTEIYWSQQFPEKNNHPQTIMVMKYFDQHWHAPEIAPFSGTYHEGGPVFSFHHDVLYFYSMRPNRDRNLHYNNIWKVKRTSSGWGVPEKLPSLINTDHFQVTPSIARDGTFIYQSFDEDYVNSMVFMYTQERNGVWAKPRKLSPHFNIQSQEWLPCIAPDASYFLYSSLREGNDFFDLYMSKRMPDLSWGNPYRLSDKINTEASERFPGITRDGKFLFFIRNSQIYWVSTKILGPLRSEGF